MFFLFLFFAINLSLAAQSTSEQVQMADGMRSSGKIYVVVAVLLTVLIGLFIFLISIDRKVSRLEKNN